MVGTRLEPDVAGMFAEGCTERGALHARRRDNRTAEGLEGDE
ncbi:hypothetical protein SBD_1919 [Streptomyces bottropensis ATCC 25435]|uniref:Uncharacterized protein n=1 Tax=Streptomyces bottropensis ATCC 25435 TaxID=1054862 RepID=M3FUE2_9ACTN|nr:hypothetical protein SBD_1919 [Streptomyces bottropensis ATCC 25435]